jgi:putative transposase
MGVPDGPNQRWSLEVVSDAFTDGRRFRILTVVDDFTKKNALLVPGSSISGLRATRELDQAFTERAMPKTIVSDNGTELTSMAVLKWVQGNGIDWHYNQPGKPTQSVHSKLQREITRRMLERNTIQFNDRCP